MAKDESNLITPSFSIPEKMKKRLEEIAQQEDRSVSSVVRRAIRLYEKKKVEEKDQLESEKE